MEKYKIIFESENIYYIQMSESLMNDYLKMYNDQEVQKNLFKKIYTYEQIQNWLKKRLLDKTTCIFSMIEKETNEFIGNIEIMEIKNNIGEIGISIIPKKQNKRFGQEAIKRLIDYSFVNLNLDGLDLNVYNFNSRGIKCYEKIGFVKDGIGKTEEDIHMSFKK